MLTFLVVGCWLTVCEYKEVIRKWTVDGTADSSGVVCMLIRWCVLRAKEKHAKRGWDDHIGDSENNLTWYIWGQNPVLQKSLFVYQSFIVRQSRHNDFPRLHRS